LATVHQGILTNTILWQPELGLSCTACETPQAKPKKTQKYVVTAQNSDGCTVTDSVLVVVVGDCAVYIPNIFTPNGDGVNDAFRIFSGGCGSILVKISIFDRFGEFIFTDGGMPVDDFKGWDGTFKGKICLNGAYACIISIEDPKGIKRTIATDVTIMR
jgi:gliding motility-associated-like protein